MKTIDSITKFTVISLIFFSMMLIGTVVNAQTPRSILESGQEISVTSNYISYRHWDSQKEDYVNDVGYLEKTEMVLQDDSFYIQWNGDNNVTKQWWVFDARRQWSCLDCFLLEPKPGEESNSVCIDYCDNVITIYYDHNNYDDGTGRWLKAILLTRLDVDFRKKD